jgi:hypothetical protein
VVRNFRVAQQYGRPEIPDPASLAAETTGCAVRQLHGYGHNREATLPCEFLIPRSNGPIDFGKVNVRLQEAAGTAEEIPYEGGATRCDPMRGGWYYDVDPATAAPTRVLTCPATCDRLEAGPGR